MESRELALRIPDYSLPGDDSVAAEESAQVLTKAVAGDRGAFEQIVLRHQRRVFMTAFRLLAHAEDAQDAAQEVFLRLYKYLRRFDDARDIAPWLYRITVNVCRDFYRKRHRHVTLSLEELEPVALPSDADAAIIRAEQRRVIAEGLKMLSEKERAALVLRDIEGLSTKEVARILGSSEGTVRSQVSTARVKIKKFRDRFGMRKT